MPGLALDTYKVEYLDGWQLRSDPDDDFVEAPSDDAALGYLRTCCHGHDGPLIHGPTLEGIKKVTNLTTQKIIYESK